MALKLGPVAAMLALATLGCGEGAEAPPGAGDGGEAGFTAAAEGAWDEGMARMDARVDSIEDVLRPVPFLSGTEEGALRRYLNQAHVGTARRLGIQPDPDSAAIQAHLREGTLVELPESTEHWVVRDLDHSLPLVTPDTRALLDELGRRFQERLDGMDLPRFRIEVTSVLRTSAAQSELRAVNPNAAAGVSSHQFGTTVDIAYAGFAAPPEPMVDVSSPGAPWVERHLARVAASVAERVAGRKSRELMAILGRLMEEMQREGKVLVTLERGQPVYHITVAERLAGP